MIIKTTTVTPEMCECGRLYKDRRNEDGKMICSACYTGLSVEDLKKLWGAPVPHTEYASPSIDFGEETNIPLNQIYYLLAWANGLGLKGLEIRKTIFENGILQLVLGAPVSLELPLQD